MKPTRHFRLLLKRHGYAHGVIDEIWKWYDFSEKKGAANW
jgi:hypothetical protein